MSEYSLKQVEKLTTPTPKPAFVVSVLEGSAAGPGPGAGRPRARSTPDPVDPGRPSPALAARLYYPGTSDSKGRICRVGVVDFLVVFGRYDGIWHCIVTFGSYDTVT